MQWLTKASDAFSTRLLSARTGGGVGGVKRVFFLVPLKANPPCGVDTHAGKGQNLDG